MNDLELPEPIDFEWDNNNELKIFRKHGISKIEAEQVFFHFFLGVVDEKHSKSEQRYNLLGVTDLKKVLFIVFTIRNRVIRIISARNADKQERQTYEKAQKNS